MDVPAFFTSFRDGSMVVTDHRFEGTLPVIGDRWSPFGEATSAGTVREARAPAVVVDCESLRRRTFTEGVLKGMRVRGADIWFMTHIEFVEDLFDAFNTSAEMVLAPYHTTASDAELEDMHSVSDCLIPVVYIVRGRCVTRRGGTDRVTRVLEDLSDLGFYRTCVLDTDDSLPLHEWELVREDYPSAVPFTGSGRTDALGFPIRVVPFRV